jgi:(p)ppGpp synthase/HD superfamily hydrolase
VTFVVGYEWGQRPLDELPREARLELAARAQAIAVIAHRGQKDKTGVDYIDHPVAVAMGFDPVEQTLECCAAWLHDVLEDTDITADDLYLAGIYPEVIEVVDLLTRRDGDGDEYYERIARNPAARDVKLADIAHNTAPHRVAQLDDATRVRLRAKYEHALELLGAAWPDHEWTGHAGWSEFGNPELYRDRSDDDG